MNEQRDTHETAGRSAAPSIEARALTRSFGDEVDAGYAVSRQARFHARVSITPIIVRNLDSDPLGPSIVLTHEPPGASEASEAAQATDPDVTYATDLQTAVGLAKDAAAGRYARRPSLPASGFASPADRTDQPRTRSAAVRIVPRSPAIMIVVTNESRHASRSWRILSSGPISDIWSMSSNGIAAAASSFLPSR